MGIIQIVNKYILSLWTVRTLVHLTLLRSVIERTSRHRVLIHLLRGQSTSCRQMRLASKQDLRLRLLGH